MVLGGRGTAADKPVASAATADPVPASATVRLRLVGLRNRLSEALQQS
jgi:hypothetical protein